MRRLTIDRRPTVVHYPLEKFRPIGMPLFLRPFFSLPFPDEQHDSLCSYRDYRWRNKHHLGELTFSLTLPSSPFYMRFIGLLLTWWISSHIPTRISPGLKLLVMQSTLLYLLEFTDSLLGANVLSEILAVRGRWPHIQVGGVETPINHIY